MQDMTSGRLGVLVCSIVFLVVALGQSASAYGEDPPAAATGAPVFSDLDSVLAYARKAVDTIDDEDVRDWTRMVLAARQAQAGEADGAVETADGVARPDLRLRAYEIIAASRVFAGDREGAKAVFRHAKGMGPAGEEAHWRGSVAVALARAGFAEAAKEEAAAATDPRVRAAIYTDIAEIQIEAGAFADAKETADLLDQPGGRWRVYHQIVEAQVKAGAFEAARETAAEIAHDCLEIPEAMARSGLFEEAKELATAMASPAAAARIYRAVAAAKAEAGDAKGAAAMFAAANDAAAQIGEATARGRTYLRTASAQAESGDLQAAKATFGLAKDAAAAVMWPQLILDIVQAQADAGAFSDAKETLRDAVGSGRAFSELIACAAHAVIAVAESRAGRFEDAKQTASALEDPSMGLFAYAAIAAAQAGAGLPDEARETLRAVDGGSDEWREAALLVEYAIAATALDSELFEEARQTADASGDPWLRAVVYVSIAREQAASGALDEARETLDAVDEGAAATWAPPEGPPVAYAKFVTGEADTAHFNDGEDTAQAFYGVFAQGFGHAMIAGAHILEGRFADAANWFATVEDPVGQAMVLLAAAGGLLVRQDQPVFPAYFDRNWTVARSLFW